MKNPLELKTLSEILSLNKENTEIAIIEGQKKITYKRLFDLSNYYAGKIKCVGEKIGILYKNSIEYVVAFFAILFSGNDVVLIQPTLKHDEVVSVLENTNVKVLFSTIEHKGTFFEKYVEQFLSIDLNVECQGRINVNPSSMNDIIIPTSGTTDKRKMVVLGQDGIKWGMYHTIEITSDDFIEREFIILSFSTRTALEGQLLVGLLLERQVYIDNTLFNPGILLKKIEKNRINHFSIAPSMIRMINNYVKENNTHCITISSLKCVTVVGEALDESVIKDIHLKFPHVFILYGYGMTETGIISFRNRRNYMETGNFVGKIDELSKIEIKIVNEDNGMGQIVVTSPGMFKRYYQMDNNVETPFFTGDIGYIKEKKLFICGREKNIINVGGIKVFPEEVENVINAYPPIIESYVYGMKDDILGEIVVADIVLCRDGKLKRRDFIGYCRSKMAEYKIPYKINIVKKIVHTTTSKVKRNKSDLN